MSTDLSFKFSMCLPENNLQKITAINFKNSMMCNEINCGAKYHTLVHKSLQWLLYTVNWLMEIYVLHRFLFGIYIPFLIVQIFQFSQKLITFPQQIKMAPINRYNLIHNFT